jgi:hypothetical protein
MAGKVDINSTGTIPTIILDGDTSSVIWTLASEVAPTISIGTGTVAVRDTSKDTIHMEGRTADFFLGGAGQAGTIVLRDGTGKDTIHVDGKSGDIQLLNADFAEDFDISGSEDIEPGTVMSFDQEGNLRQSQEAYDKKVAGVLSGAGNYKPGIVLDRNESQQRRKPLALVGKVYCKVDARCSPIEVGDLLTSSPTPGHAMKADDHVKAFGAVIGKALTPLGTGQGLIRILVALR